MNSGLRKSHAVVQFVELGGAACLAFVAVMSFVSVFMRYLFSSPIPDSFDFSQLLFGVLIFWGIAAATFHGAHIQMDALWSLCGKGGRWLMDVVSALLVLLFIALFTVVLWDKVHESIVSGETTFGLGIVIWPFHVVAALGIFAATPLALVRFWTVVRDGYPNTSRGRRR